MAGVLVALAFIVFFYSGAIFLMLRSQFPMSPSLKRLVPTYVVLGVLVGAVSFSNPGTAGIANYFWPVVLFLLVSIIAAAPSIMGIWVIDSALVRISSRIKEASQEQSLDRDPDRRARILADLIQARTKLLALLSAVGALIGAAVLTTGALRNALLAARSPDGKAVKYPIEYVLVYGLFFSALLAVIYIPVYLHLQDRSRIHRIYFPSSQERIL
jgi:hypothetical protein